ncbi:MAG: DUF2461 domain-containing protein [Vicinamibacterales bacterium]
MAASGFDRAFFAFLRDLKAHNDREWFAANKARYLRDVEAPARQFIADFAPRLKAISPRFVADPRRVGGSLYRIHRDTRFSADKSPFKTHVAMRFSHDARGEASVPGFYLHLEPGESLGGGGIYHPAPPSLRRIRDWLATNPRDWREVQRAEIEVEGERLRRVPRGFPSDHPLADDLRRKDFYALTTFTAAEVAAPDFLDRYAATCESVAPLVRFLTGALGLRW